LNSNGTLLITGAEAAELLSIEDCMNAVETAFKLQAQGKVPPTGILGMHAQGGGFHIKAGMLEIDRKYFAVKVNGNFFENSERFGLPRIQGIVVLCDAENGYPLAVMDSIEITILRTGAATGVAARHLARPDASIMTICGCGNQGKISFKAISKVRPIKKVYAYDIDPGASECFAKELRDQFAVEIIPTTNLRDATSASDICITCTPSREAFLGQDDVSAGTFIAAVGADSEEKQELNPALVASSKLVVDNLEQCAKIGELHHALDAGLMTRSDVHAELGEVIAGLKPARESVDEIIVFDSTGTGIQDVAAAAVVYENALKAGFDRVIKF
jgi:alanine dehydrogenase